MTDIEDGVLCALTNKYALNNKDIENQDILVIFMTPQLGSALVHSVGHSSVGLNLDWLEA